MRNSKGQFAKGRNNYIIKNGLVFVFRNNELLFYTDNVDVENYVWCKQADGYSATFIDGKEVSAHRFVAGANVGELVDHINRNKRDNRTSNLRICNKSQNAYNTARRSTNTSGRTGVWYRKDTNKWVAEIKHMNKKINLGCFGSKEEAIKAREDAEAIYCGEFVPRSKEAI